MMGLRGFLRELLEVELRSPEERAAKRCLKEAHFPDMKTLEQLDWDALRGISKPKIMELASCEYIIEPQHVVFAGPVGTGKTLAAVGLVVEATRRWFRVAFFRAANLVRTLTEARDERTLTLLHRRLRRVALLILDELEFVPVERAGGELHFDLISEWHKIRSTMITTDLSFAEWVQVYGDEKLTTALLDRLGHHAHVLTTRAAPIGRANVSNRGS
jgi:DNA replication protein DnaC